MRFPLFVVLTLILSPLWAQLADVHEPLVSDSGALHAETNFIFEADTDAKGDLTISFCGNGVHEDGELCFDSPNVVSMEAQPFDISDLEVGYLNGGNNLDFVAGRTVNNSFHAKLGSGNGSFYATYNYSMGADLLDIALGDFDGDGLTDVIGTDQANDRVYIRWGHSTWSSYNYYSVGNGPSSVAVADFNGDGDDDFVTMNGFSTSYSVGLRSGSSFSRTTTYNDEQVRLARLGDVDGDGDIDLLFSEGNAASCRRNNGAGSFGARQPIYLGGYDFGLQDFAVGDIDNDGHDDLIAVYYGNTTLVRVLSDGDGTFSARATASADMLPHGIDLHDMDGDGNLDMLLGGASGIFIFLGDGHGNFIKAKTIASTQVMTVRAGDFNNDGSADLIHTTNILGGDTAVRLHLANP
jgi:FG-GAP-like repeat